MISRRNLLRGSAAISAAGPLVPAAFAAQADPKKSDAYDIVILGAGTAGLVAAIEAHDLGLKPVVLEKMDYAAGNSLYASGGIAAWGTPQQKAEGHEESREAFRADMMKVSENRADPALVDTYVSHIGEDLEWLKSHVGVQFGKIGRKPWPLLYRMHNVDGKGLTGGARLIRDLLKALQDRGIPLLFNTKAMELITDEHFRVVGVKTVTDDGWKNFYARDGVLIATGGFSGSREMLCRYMASTSRTA